MQSQHKNFMLSKWTAFNVHLFIEMAMNHAITSFMIDAIAKRIWVGDFWMPMQIFNEWVLFHLEYLSVIAKFELCDQLCDDQMGDCFDQSDVM